MALLFPAFPLLAVVAACQVWVRVSLGDELLGGRLNENMITRRCGSVGKMLNSTVCAINVGEL